MRPQRLVRHRAGSSQRGEGKNARDGHADVRFWISTPPAFMNQPRPGSPVSFLEGGGRLRVTSQLLPTARAHQTKSVRGNIFRFGSSLCHECLTNRSEKMVRCAQAQQRANHISKRRWLEHDRMALLADPFSNGRTHTPRSVSATCSPMPTPSRTDHW